MRINRNNGNKSLKGLKQGQGQGLDHKDQDKDKDLTHKDKDLTPKDQDKDKDLKNVLKESLRTGTRINIPGLTLLVTEEAIEKKISNAARPNFLIKILSDRLFSRDRCCVTFTYIQGC